MFEVNDTPRHNVSPDFNPDYKRSAQSIRVKAINGNWALTIKAHNGVEYSDGKLDLNVVVYIDEFGNPNAVAKSVFTLKLALSEQPLYFRW